MPCMNIFNKELFQIKDLELYSALPLRQCMKGSWGGIVPRKNTFSFLFVSHQTVRYQFLMCVPNSSFA